MVNDLRVSGVELATRAMRHELNKVRQINDDQHRTITDLRSIIESMRHERIEADEHRNVMRATHVRAMESRMELVTAYRNYAGCWLALERLMEDADWRMCLGKDCMAEARRMVDAANFQAGF